MKQDSKNLGGRPKAFKRGTVLDAAVLVFWEKGYDGASLGDLTQAMGINRPSLYAEFGNKHALFLEAIDRYTAVQGAAQAAPLRQEADLKSAVAGYYQEIIRTVCPPQGPCGCLIASVAAEVAERDDDVRAKISGNLSRSEAFLTDRVLASGLFPKDAAPATARMILSAGMSFAQRARLGASADDLHGLAQTYVTHFFPDPETQS